MDDPGGEGGTMLGRGGRSVLESMRGPRIQFSLRLGSTVAPVFTC